MKMNREEYAISSWILDRSPLTQALDTIARYGFDTLEIWADIVHLDPRLAPDVKAVKRALQKNGQVAHSLHAPFRSPFPHPEEEAAFREYRMDLWRKTIDTCQELEAPIMVIHAVERSEYNYPLSQANVVYDCLASLCAYGAARGVDIALENIAPSSVPYPEEISCTLAVQSKLFAGMGLKYCLDIAHVPLNGADMHEEIDSTINDLVSFHISNNDGVYDSHALPYDGILNWDEIHDYARAAGYTGRFVLELFGGEDQENTLRRAAQLFD